MHVILVHVLHCKTNLVNFVGLVFHSIDDYEA